MGSTELTQEFLKEWLSYDPETGIFYWLPRPHSYRRTYVAGCDNGNGYVIIRFKWQLYLAHRLAFFYMTGLWPKEQIDHINGKRYDNRWVNLREASPSENGTNRIVKGYYKHTRKGRPGIWFTARIEKNGKVYTNTFRSEEKAKNWREAKEIELFGEFRREIIQ